MERTEALWEILRTEYGITTIEELDDAIRKLPRLDISVFCIDARQGGLKNGRKGKKQNRSRGNGSVNGVVRSGHGAAD